MEDDCESDDLEILMDIHSLLIGLVDEYEAVEALHVTSSKALVLAIRV